MLAGLVDPARTRELRRSVLRPHLAIDDELPGDELGELAVHFAAWQHNAADDPISACFIYGEACPFQPEIGPAWHLRQMATDPQHRGTGAGSAVLAAVRAYAVEHGGRLLWCNARVSAAGFYQRDGFASWGQVFTDERHVVPHIRMFRPLP